jgi:hypothetical protein
VSAAQSVKVRVINGEVTVIAAPHTTGSSTRVQIHARIVITGGK